MTEDQANKIAAYLSQAFGADAYDYSVVLPTLDGMTVTRPNGFYVQMEGERHSIEVGNSTVYVGIKTEPEVIVSRNHDVFWWDGEIHFTYETEGLDDTVIHAIGMCEVRLNEVLARSKRNADDKQ